MEENNVAGASASGGNTNISDDIRGGPSVQDILTSINKHQSEIVTPTVKKRSSIFSGKEDVANNFEWREYQAKRLQAIKILKQEKESRLKEEMKRLGLKTVTPDLKARLEAQFQYLHEALLPDAGLDEEQAAAAAAARKGKPSKKKSKKSTSVHWSKEVVEKTASKTSKMSFSKRSNTNTSVKSGVVTLGVSKSASSTKMPKTKSKKFKKSGSTSAIRVKSKAKKIVKPKINEEEVENYEKNFDSELKRMETVEAGAKVLLSKLSGKFGSLNEAYDSTNIPEDSANEPRSSAAKIVTVNAPGVEKVKKKMSAPKMKVPSGRPLVKRPLIQGPKSNQRSNSAARVKSQTKQEAKHIVQSSGYGPSRIQKKSASMKGNINVNNDSEKKNAGNESLNKTPWLLKKTFMQQNATGARNVQKGVTKSEMKMPNEVPKLKATPIVARNNILKLVNPAGRSKSIATPTVTATANKKLNVKSEIGATNAVHSKPALLDKTIYSKNSVNIKANKSASLNTYKSPFGNPTAIAELYPVNSHIANGVGNVVDQANIKDGSGSTTNDIKTDKVASSSKKSELIRPAQRKPPKFPTVDLCNVFPGTKEWDAYWEKFNGQISTYYKEMDDYLKSMNDLTMDLEDYSKELRKIQMGNQAFAMKLGMNPNFKSSSSVTPKDIFAPQLSNKTLEPGIYNVNSYIIKNGGGRIPGLKLSTVGDIGFSLTLDLDEIDIDPQLITVETEFNVMTISVPTKNDDGKVRTIQIRVPTRASVNDLSLKEVQRISKTGATTKTLVIEGR